MGDKQEFPSAFRDAMAAQLSTGDYHDFVINCRGHTFKVHRNIIAAQSDFFKASVSLNFKEGVTHTLDLSDDDPAIVARMLTYMYTGEYCVKSLSSTPSGLELAQFRGIKDIYDLQPYDWCQYARLHCRIFAMADKYNVKDLYLLARARFQRSLWEEDDEDDKEDDDEDGDEDGYDKSNSPFSTEQAEKVARVVREIYSSTPAHVRALRDRATDVVSWWTQNGKIFSHEVMRRVLTDVPEFARDLAVVDRRETVATCSGCEEVTYYNLGLCSCGTTGLCSSQECQQIWKKGSICNQCYTIGTMAYPKYRY